MGTGRRCLSSEVEKLPPILDPDGTGSPIGEREKQQAARTLNISSFLAFARQRPEGKLYGNSFPASSELQVQVDMRSWLMP